MLPDPHPLRISLLLDWEPPAEEPLACEEWLPPQRFVVECFQDQAAFLEALRKQDGHVDCLVLLVDPGRLQELHDLGNQLCAWGLLLPTVLAIVLEESHLETEEHSSRVKALLKREQFFYHNATLVRPISPQELKGQARADCSGSPSVLELLVDRAIALFLQMSPTCGLPQGPVHPSDQPYLAYSNQQQRRLAEKLRERLGYAGVYYHRDPELFYRRLPPHEQRALMQRLRGLYQTIVLEYFQSPETANARIDELVALAFFADIGAAQLLELHMNLMEDFAKQLKLEGRSEEILLDYRLTLIDVMAHLSEMYRRSIPKPAPRDP
ncbi:circadian clock protein KaiA [Synechococcus sp. H55.10]|uniref:circadian clock protein KaiA n=1 Tax=Synechococcus sp. H55.10 TaxID=2964503 RepID=UPI0039C73BDF